MRRSSLMIAVLVLLALGLSTAAFAEIGRWPISNSSANTADVLTSAYGPRYVSPTRPYDVHEGVDIRAQTPLPVYPWKSGTIEYLGGSENGTGGWWVKVTHPENGFRTGYYHLTYDELYRNLKKWDPVSQGTAFVNSGESGGVIPHLHFNYLLGSVSNPPDNPGQDVLDNARNPMQILSYDNDSGPWTYGGTLYLSGDYITACSFTVQTGGAELDLDRVEVEVLHPFYDNVVIDISQRSNVYDTWGAGDGEFYATTDNGLQMRVLIDPDEFSDSQTGDQTINFLFNIADAWPNVPSSSNSLIATAYDLGGRHERVIWETGVNREIVNFTATGGYQQVTLNWDAYDFDPNIWFNIYRSIDGGVSYPDSMGSVQYRGDGSYSFVDNTVEYDYEYRYMIEDTEGPGWWGPVSASPTGGVSTPPAPSPPPTIYMADTGFETISIHLLGGSDYASSYQIGYDPDGAEPYEHSDYFTGSTHDLRNLSNGLRYYIAVRGINASGSSGYSNQVNAIPEGRHPAQNLSFEQISGENIDYWYPYGSGTFGSSTVSRDGSRSAYLSSSSGSGYFGFNQRYIAVQPNTTYYLGVWVKTQGVTQGAAYAAFGVWAEGEANHHVDFGAVGGAGDWTYISGSWTSQSNEDRIEIKLYGDPDLVEEAWFDGQRIRALMRV